MLLCGVKAGCARTIRNWYLDFGKKKRKFDMSLPRKHKLPMFLDRGPYREGQGFFDYK